MSDPNYYQEVSQADSLRYRLDAGELIEQAVDTFKGGVVGLDEYGKKVFFEGQRLMNDLGIQRARMVLEAGVNKINHLTKYKDEERAFRQVKSITRMWIYEVTLNMKKWAPEATFDANGKLINEHTHKIRNKHLIIAVVENAILQSMLRATAGFEAELTGKQMVVSEHKDYSMQTKEDPHAMGGWFGGKGGGM